uniref:Rho-GAP domain-containing protein n=1 Tax=Hippocampus comes TaxID=109280 RepID=A0A3Q2Y3K5_HIPCM
MSHVARFIRKQTVVYTVAWNFGEARAASQSLTAAAGLPTKQSMSLHRDERRSHTEVLSTASLQFGVTYLTLSATATQLICDSGLGVFGQRLEETVLYERRYGVRSVPLVVEQCVAFIRERGLQEVGLFRQPGRASLVRELQEAFDAGERPSFDSNTDVHTVASLLKLYLRQLPEPLIPFSHYQDFLLSGQKLSSDRTQGLGELRNLLQELPVANFNLLKFLNEVQSHSKGNKMSCQNLATVFGPNILRAKAEDPESIMGGKRQLTRLRR